jgi:single-stranded-DNA-specific exonuclease
VAALTEPQVRWQIATRNPEAEQKLQAELGIPALVAAILVRRGMDDPAAADKFLRPKLDDLGDPRLLPDYDAAVKAILGARERKEKIYVHGDYDVDGVTSAALLTRFLRKIGCEVEVHVPHRKEGYGINMDAVEVAIASGAKLFLTCDCGVSAHQQVERALEAGMTVVVTDHHSIGGELPRAHAIVNPHREDSRYPFNELSGVGVAFRLCEGITRELEHPVDGYRRAYLDLAVLGTVADVMPLVDENRIITRHGLPRLLESKKIGLQALMTVSNTYEKCKGNLLAWHIGFVLGPRLNATGRIDDAARALHLLLSEDRDQAMTWAKEIEEINEQRRAQQEAMIEQAIEKVMEQGLHKRHVIVVGDEDWHSGIIGLVAGRLVEKFRRPAYVMSIDPVTGMVKGSARSIPGFNLADCIRAHGDLVSGGGHAMAAGFSTDRDRAPLVMDAFDAYARQLLTEEDFVPLMCVDAEVAANEFTLATAEALALLEPFGNMNPEPMFLARRVEFAQVLPTRKPEHPRLKLRQEGGRLIKATAFGMGERIAQLGQGFLADVVFQARINEWQGSRSLEWCVKHFEPLPTLN